MNAAEKRYQNALTALNERRFSDAERHFRRFLQDHPSHVGALNLLTIVLTGMERYAEAEPVIARALKLNQSSDVSFYNHGLILKHLGKPKEAYERLTQALRLKRTVPDTWNCRGTVLNDLGQYQQAIVDFDQAIALNPNHPAAYANKARALAGLNRFDEALGLCDRALALDPRLTKTLLARGAVLALLDRHDEAFAAYAQALAVDPGSANAHAGIGNVLRELGRLDEARESYLKAIAVDPRRGEFLYHYANIKRVEAGDPQIAAMEALAAADDLTHADRMCLHFGLGKAYADVADHAQAFAHWLEGNSLKRQQIDFDEAAVAAHVDELEEIFTPTLIAEKSGQGDPSSVPVFVLGMPRSGTTLVEQILASHPQVYGAGELKILDDVLAATPGADGKSVSYPRYVPALDGPAIRRLGARYVAALSKFAPQAAHITDKTPGNFFYVGMIHMTMPNAKIVHTARNPVDTCLSCFSNLFSDTLNFTYDLGELGRHYARYQRLMAHWHRVLPPGTVLDVRYEDVVADLEGQARRILDHCGLAWDPRCLAFNETVRPVRTASATQVRQPIYRHSVERWRVYEESLGPLLRELGLPAGAP